MQNRLVLTGVPPSVPQRPNASDSLRDFIEEHACWVDRFAFISSNPVEDASGSGSENNDGAMMCVAAAELHIENVRDRAVKSLNEMVVCMDREGGILVGADHDTKERQNCNTVFHVKCRPATAAESSELIRKCPIESDDPAADKRMEKQTLKLPSLGIELTARRSEVHGGTGTYPWRGGLILSMQICHWASAAKFGPSVSTSSASDGKKRKIIDSNHVDFKSLFCNKLVLELGAGAAGLPSMTLGKLSKSFGLEIDLVSSDGVDEIVNALKVNIADNELGDCIRVEHIDWNKYANRDEKDNITKAKADTIIFADCIYNEDCAVALSQTIFHLLKSGGSVIGVLPDFRVGLDLFEKRMRENNFISSNVPIIALDKNDVHFACSGGGGKEYRLLLWRDCRS